MFKSRSSFVMDEESWYRDVFCSIEDEGSWPKFSWNSGTKVY